MANQQRLAFITNGPRTVYRFIFEARDELKKVSWPDRATTVRYTTIVVIASLAVGGIVGGIDYLLTILLETVLV